MPNRPLVVVFGRDTLSTRVIASALGHYFETCVVLERPPSIVQQLKFRFRLFGWRRACGQILFHLASPVLALPQKRRRRQLREKLNRRLEAFIPHAVVDSINSAQARAALRMISPDVMVLSGTRIVGNRTLSTVPMTINMHAGITPKYRGVHGGYWASVEGDLGNVGVTIHKVDQGVDTGDVIVQARVVPSTEDGFYTLPLLQLDAGVAPLVDAVRQLLTHGADSLQSRSTLGSDSRQWFHPTLYEYLRNGLVRGVW